MRKKSIIVFGLLSLLALGTVGVAIAPIGYMSNNLERKGDATNYTQTFDHLDEKNGQLGLTTKNGNFIKVYVNNKPSAGLAELNFYDEFALEDPIGGIISMKLDMSVGGKTYPGEVLDCPYKLEFAYLVDPINTKGDQIWYKAGEGYENEYIWGQGKDFETPSFLKLTSLEDGLTIKSITLTYNCSHLALDDAFKAGTTYLLLEDPSIPGTAHGQIGERQGDQLAFYLDLIANETFYFKKIKGEKLAITLASDGEEAANAILKGYVGFNAETNVFTALQDIQIGIYIKDSGVTYVTFNKLIDQDWYVTGENLTLSDELVASCWGEIREDAMMDQVEYWTFTYQPFIAQAGDNVTLLKLMSGDKKVWIGYDNLDNPEGIVERGNDGNIKFIKSGTYRIDLYFEYGLSPYFVINPCVG